MADSIPGPWISDYLVGLGEQYGAEIGRLPLFTKKKKVRLSEFLSVIDAASPMDTGVWVKVSDAVHEIPVRIREEALKEYNKNNARPLMNRLGALVCIKDFRPIFTRVPVGNGVRKNSVKSRLALSTGFIEVIGSEGERIKATTDVETNVKIRKWTEGLREDGGGGNVLKLAKEAEDASSRPPSVAVKSPRKKSAHSPAKHEKQAKISLANAVHCSALTKISVREYERHWRHTTGLQYEMPEDRKELLRFWAREGPALNGARPKGSRSPASADILCDNAHPRQNALDFDSSQPDALPLPEDQALVPMPSTPTPSEWPPSDPESPVVVDDGSDHDSEPASDNGAAFVHYDHELPLERRTKEHGSSPAIPVATQTDSSAIPSSHLAAPTPAQRPNPNFKPQIERQPTEPLSSPALYPTSSAAIPASTAPQFLLLASPPIHLRPRTADSSPDILNRSTDSSHILPDVSSLPKHSSSLPTYSVTTTEIRRRIPYPNSPPRPDPDQTGERILVPNSDTSTSASQGVSQDSRALSLLNGARLEPQSQSQSQPLLPSHDPCNVRSTKVTSPRHTLVDTEHGLPSPAESSDSDDIDAVAASIDVASTAEVDVLGDDDIEVDHGQGPNASVSVVECSQDDQLDDDDAQTDAILRGIPIPQPKFEGDEVVERNHVSSTPSITNVNDPPTTTSSCHAIQSSSLGAAKNSTFNPNAITPHSPTNSGMSSIDRSRKDSTSADPNTPPSLTRRFLTPVETSASSRPGKHSPDDWTAPSFMLSKQKGKGKGKGKAISNINDTLPPSTLRASMVHEDASTSSLSCGAVTSSDGCQSRHRSRHRPLGQQANGECSKPFASSSAIAIEDISSTPAEDPRTCIPRQDLSKMKKRRRDSMAFSCDPFNSLSHDNQRFPKRKKLDNSIGFQSLQNSEQRLVGVSTQSIEKKLKGFTVDFNSIPIDKTKGPKLGWDQLHAILLRTGKLRTKVAEKTARKKERRG